MMMQPGARFRTISAFLLTGVLISAAMPMYLAAQAARTGPPPVAPKLEKIKDDLYVIENSDVNRDAMIYWGGNATAYVTNDGVILVDAKYARAHDDLVAKVKSLTDKPIKYVVLTHNHADHAEGAQQLAAMGATVMISAADRENLAMAANPAWLPELTYIGQARLFLGGKEAQIYQFRGHTRGDTVVYFPADRVIALGDLLTTTPVLPPIVNYADGGSWVDWDRSIDEVLKMDFDIAIPGHGPVVTKAQIAEIRGKMLAIQQRLRTMNREGKSAEEIAAALTKEFNFTPFGNQIPAMMQELR
jgi:glyoxylase-like metal-dependent hydrolase (beta-lactamase superfamily II)